MSIKNLKGKDQKFFFETVKGTKRRLERVLLENRSSGFSYFGKCDLKGAAPYKDLYVLVLVGNQNEIPSSWKDYLHNVDETLMPTRLKNKVLASVAFEVKQNISNLSPK